MPRSGSTLQFNIAWKVVEAGQLGQRIEWRSSEDWAREDQELRNYANDKTVNVIKMHFPPDNVKELAETSSNVKFVYVHREIPDVVYSMQTKFKFSLARAIKRVSQALEAEKWLLNRPETQVLIQDYTQLLNKLPSAITDVSNFIDAKIASKTINALAAELSIESAYKRSRQSTPHFEHLRRRVNRLLGRKITFADDELLLHPNHVSEHRGQIGIGRHRLNADDLKTLQAAFGSRIDGILDDSRRH